STVEPRRKTPAVAPRRLVFAVGPVDGRKQENGKVLRITFRRKVDQPAPAVRLFEREDAADAPERRLPARARALTLFDELRATGYQPYARRMIGPSDLPEQADRQIARQ